MTIPILLYTHSDCIFLHPATFGQIDKWVEKNIPIYFCYNSGANILNIPSNYIQLTYNDNIIWTDKVLSLINQIDSKYILFLHEDWLPVSNVYYDMLSNMGHWMDQYNVDYLMSYSHIKLTPETPGIYSGVPDYYFYNQGCHVFQPAIWRKSMLEELCTKFKKSKCDNENLDTRIFTATKQCWAIQNIKTFDTLRSVNSLFFPHMHALCEGVWNFTKYKGVPELNIPSLKSLIEQYNIDTTTKGVHTWWDLTSQ